jgi:flagellin-like hook-associated protein FlgL
MTVYPVPTTRSNGLLEQTRLLTQLRSDQLDLLRLQTQISTGRRISTPSEDAPAAIRGMALQRLLEQKAQVQVNLATSQSYLSATDAAVAGVSELIAKARGTAVASVGSTSGVAERLAAAEEIRRTLAQLVDVGNQEFRGRHLFAGARTEVAPFSRAGEYVVFRGNRGELRSFTDVDLLYATNVPGDELFGAISPQVLGTADWNPVLSERTRISDLRRGEGIHDGGLLISDGVDSRTVDITGAETLADVVRRIEDNSEGGPPVIARIGPTGLTLELGAGAAGFNLSVAEVGNGVTAAELGLFRPSGVGLGPLAGDDLNPKLRLTTALDDVLGARAAAVVHSAGMNNDLVFTARQRGPQNNGVRVQFVDDRLLHAAPGLPAGAETASFSAAPTPARAALEFSGAGNNLLLTAVAPGIAANDIRIEIADAGAIGDAAQVSFDATTRTLTIGIDSAGATQVQTVVQAIDNHGLFTAAHDASDAADGAYNPAATIAAADAGAVTGNTGNSGGDANTVFVFIRPGETTAAQALAALEASASVSERFEVRLDSKDENPLVDPGSGLIDVDATAVTAGGSGVEFDQDSGLQIVNNDETHVIDFHGAETVEDLLNILNGSSAFVTARINEAGNGIDIQSLLSGADFHIGENGGLTATHLGVRSYSESTLLADLNHGLGVHEGEGDDFVIVRNDGVELSIDLDGAETIGDVLRLINEHPENLSAANRVTARLNTAGNGIELIDDNPLSDERLTVRKATLSNAAWDLGLIVRGQNETTSADIIAATPPTASIAFAPPANQDNALTISAASGTQFNGVRIVFIDGVASGDQALVSYDPGAGTLTIDIDPAATTALTVVDAVNAEGTFDAALDVTSDAPNDGSGLIAALGELAVLAGGEPERLLGADTNPQEVRGVFNSLHRLAEALVSSDAVQIERATALLDEDLSRVNFVRAELGARQQSLDVLEQRLGTEEIELSAALSDEIDVDLAEAISNLTARQAALEATLRLASRTHQLSLLDFL